MDAVRADDQVVAAGRAVSEAHTRRGAGFHVRDRGAESDRRFGGCVAECLVQRRPVDRQAAADTVPEPIDVDVGQATTTMVEEPLPPDRLCSCDDCRSDAEFTQSAYGVAGQVQAGAGLVQSVTRSTTSLLMSR